MSILNTPRNNIVAMIEEIRRTSRKTGDRERGDRGDTLDVLARKVGVGRNTLARVRANPHCRVKPQLEQDIAATAFRMFEYPWSLQAEDLCREIRTAILERDSESPGRDPVRDRWGFLIGADIIPKLKAEPDTAISDRTEEAWGLLISAYCYIVAVCFVEPRPLECRQQEDDDFDLLSHRLFDWLRPHSEHLWAFFVEFQVISNLIGLSWNQTPAEERGSESMWNVIVSRGYFGMLSRYMTLCPRDADAVANALAYASKCGATEHFPGLRDLLVTAYGGREPAYTEENGFDDDFDGYRNWLNSL